jgi:glucose/arabinose dehydrogenase
MQRIFDKKLLLSLVLSTIYTISSFSQEIKLQFFAKGFIKPVDITSTGIAGDTRLFITEKDGRIKILTAEGTILAKPFLDIDAKVNSQANERGLLGLAFHPKYKENGYFFVHYTNTSGHSTISRFKVDSNDENSASTNSEKIIMVVNQPFNNHNAGDLEFAKNGYLYIGMGDGGNGGDPGNRSQNPKELLGKMLRIDVDTEDAPYKIPADNPYINRTDTLPEIWSLGLRNPWRISIDPVTNDLWIADVGQDRWEEVNVANADIPKLNYGWRCYEGNAKFNFSTCKDATPFHRPVYVYANQFNIGCSVTGGFVYRGSKFADLEGKYIYCDFCTGIFWSITKNSDGTYTNEQIGDFEEQEYATFGTDIRGEMYVAGLGNGTIFKVESIISQTQESSLDPNVTLHPNPVADMITISSDQTDLSKTQWSITGIDSKITLIPSIISASTSQIQLDVKELPSGIYFAQDKNSKIKVKFVKM